MTDETRKLANRYEVRGLVGRGGMADVHAGFDTRLGREVAIKILRSELARDPAFLHRFRREAQAAASLNHPSIVAVFDSGEDEHTDTHGQTLVQPFIVMEYVHGITLRERLAEAGCLSLKEACDTLTQVLAALGYSHSHGIVHRDIKPGNVMVTPTGVAKVMDFGIARAIADSAATMTNTSVVIGTAQYLSPEQAQGREIDARSDIYSAGCLLYELVTGRTPFIGESPVSIAYQHVGEPPQSPSVFNEEIPAALDHVILHALEKSPADRYQSAEEFDDDIKAFLKGESPQAHGSDSATAVFGAAKNGEATDVHHVVPAKPQEPARRKRRWLIPLVATFVVVSAFLGVLASQGLLTFAEKTVAVPNLVQKTDAQAQQALSELGLAAGKETTSNPAKAGTVLSQNPAAGNHVQVGSTVSYVVSSGPATLQVPDLRNFEQAAARQTLEDRGLAIQAVEPIDSKDVSAGNVVSTDPPAGTSVKEGTKVTLNVSTGRVTVPNLVGLSREDAIRKLKEAGLGRVFTPVRGNGKPGTVLSQSYQKGEKVPVGTVIELNIVSEPPPAPTATATVTIPPSPSPSPPASGPIGEGDDPGEEPDPNHSINSGKP
ncbi:Stk1 family PASTA domain-containing Ser/Thr kinase [Dermatophilus congolensis]|uniref:Stk1 family PASTA domain-containing Ser/Thr kinase n=1 Tax=Dermatophilus congolensis TaxID=1863 RepID=UPI001AB03D2D|nr:Stk1 family PASTA domain-containing Ser/Thr kinase [Dermatophilus congolensis]MBO3211501.1 Stk1 family PASTA domain-containing Ser/Thr kinase [Dermatophilus congolensis]